MGWNGFCRGIEVTVEFDEEKYVGSGLYLDVSGYSWNEGDAIDLWYQNNQANQTFETVPW